MAANALNNFKLQEEAVPKIQIASVNSVTLVDFLELKVYALTKLLEVLEFKHLEALVSFLEVLEEHFDPIPSVSGGP